MPGCRPHLNVVPDAVGGVEADNAIECDALLLHELCQHLLRLFKQLLGLWAHGGVVEDLGVATVGVAAAQLPHLPTATAQTMQQLSLARFQLCWIAQPRSGKTQATSCCASHKHAPVMHKLSLGQLLQPIKIESRPS